MPEKPIILETAKLAKITLNAPQKLNALDMQMIVPLGDALAKWNEDENVKVVLIKGAGDKAFCAGGDVVGVCQQAKTDKAKAAEFFWAEYRTNWRIQYLSKPYIALMDGYVMGGGVGVSVHGDYRVVTERTMLSMPETAIGFFPDVGGTYFLSRLKGGIGMFMGLTGHGLFAADLVKLGIATHYIASNKLAALETALEQGDINSVLDTHCTQPPEPCQLPIEQISQLFDADNLNQIMANLKADDSEFSLKIQKTIAKMSPTSLRVTFAQIKRGAGLDFDQCMRLELRMATHMLEHNDFYEGVRALLVDKDRNPQWQGDINEAQVESYFDEIEKELSLDWNES